MVWRGFAIGSLCALVGLWGCSDLKEDVVGPAPSGDGPLTYQADIRPLLLQNCSECHTGGRAEGNYDLSSFPGLLGRGTDEVRNAIPGDSRSLFVTVLQPGGIHANLVAGSVAEALRKWVVEDSLGLVSPTVHPSGWMDVRSEEFHGQALREQGWFMEDCQTCHGADYAGGVAQSSCLSCHVNTPEDCSTCHGTGLNAAPPLDLSGNFISSARGVGAHQIHVTEGMMADPLPCGECHVEPERLHDAGHVDSGPPAEVVFGALAKTGGTGPIWDGRSCSNVYCHGTFKGGNRASPVWVEPPGIGQAACGTCHEIPPPPSSGHPQNQPCERCHGDVVDADLRIVDKTLHVNGRVDVQFHPENFADPQSPNFHGVAIRAAGWTLSGCQTCHGAGYAGGTVQVSCLSCHANTPEDCSVCHGSALSSAPPPDLGNNTSPGARGVGAHRSHLESGLMAEGVACGVCHVVPARLGSAGHVDSDLPAEVVFGGLAKAGGAQPAWDGMTCANTYCHGAFKGGNAAAPVWTAVGVGEGACGTCHEVPPPPSSGHPTSRQCSRCHSRVVDENLRIVDRSLHMNGIVEIDP